MPNIVFILTDDLGWKDLSCYGNAHTETPILDSLARSGVLFTQAYAACPVCSPTQASILTGKYPARLGLTNFLTGNRTDPASPVLPPPNWKTSLSAGEITLPELLNKRGYTTGMSGKGGGVGRLFFSVNLCEKTPCRLWLRKINENDILKT